MPKPRIRLKHQLLKSQARAIAHSILAESNVTKDGALCIVRFEPIDCEALAALVEWGDNVHFSWEKIQGWKAREPWSLDLSIWSGTELCGLCFANPNQSRLRTKIIRLEGKPDSHHPLKNRIAALTMIAVEQYARLIGSEWLEIQEPAQGALAVYRDLGFQFDAFSRLVVRLD